MQGVEDACSTVVSEDVYDAVRSHLTSLVVCAPSEEMRLPMCEIALLCLI